MADEGKVTVYGSKFSPYGHRVVIALREKEIPFELILVDFKNKPQGLLDANPIHKKVPAIVHYGKPLAESLVILEYLEDAFPEKAPLMPKDAYDRSQVRFWVDYVCKTIPVLSEGLRAQPGSPKQKIAIEGIGTFYKTLDTAMTKFSPAGPFFTGDKFGLIDVVLAPIAHTMGFIQAVGGPSVAGPDDYPRLYGWLGAVKARPSVMSTLPSGEETSQFLKGIFQNLSVSAPAGPQ